MIPSGQYILGFVLRSTLGVDCTNGGASSREQTFRIIEGDGLDVQESARAKTLRVVRRDCGRGEYVHVEPLDGAGEGRTHYMAGGNYVVSSDARWREWMGTPYPIPVHDRTDTWRDYESLTR